MDKNSCASRECHKEDDEDMVSCDKCKRWWHFTCADLYPDQFDTLTPWFCSEEDCSTLVGEITDAQATSSGQQEEELQLDSLLEAATVAQASVFEKETEIASLRSELEGLKLKLAATSPKDKQSVVSNVNDRIETARRIQANHKLVLKSSSQNRHSTPAKESPESEESFHENYFQQSEIASLLTILNRNNIQELPTFSGEDKREWPYFEDVFKSTTVEGKFNGKENVARLRKTLRGEAYQLVGDRLKYSSDANAIVEVLRSIYGRSDVLVHSLTSDLLNLPTLSSYSDPRLRQWAVKVKGYVADVKSLKMEKDLDNGYVLTDLASKLGTSLFQDWRKKKAAIPNANLEDFAEFLMEKVIDLPPDPVKSWKPAESKAKSSKTYSRVLSHQPVAPSPARTLCGKCRGQQHPLSQCQEFKMLSPEQRFEYAKGNGICFSCLDQSKHNWRTCSKRKACGIDGCSKRHNPLLHSPLPVIDSELNIAACPYVPQPQIHSSHFKANLPVMFKVVPIRVYGNQRKFVDTFALLDDGSAITMFEKDLFDELELKGKPEKLTLQWTKGVSRVEESVSTTLSVSGVNKRKQYQLKGVFCVKGLELPSQSVNVNHLKSLYPHLRGLPLQDLDKAKPKILIGLDQAKFLLGHGQRYGKDEEPCALKTLLGWIVYGTSTPEINVSCVQQAKPSSMQFMFHDAIKRETELDDLGTMG